MDPRFNPYSYQYPYYQRPSFLQQARYSLKQISLSQTLQTTKSVLYTANQIIPIVIQLRPVVQNATAAFKMAKVMKSFKDE